MASRRAIVHLMLALVLLLAQQVVSAHPFSHRAGAGDTQDDPSRPAELVVCALCVAGAVLGSALPGTGHAPFVSAAQVFEPAPLTWTYRPPAVRAFSARAPPTLL